MGFRQENKVKREQAIAFETWRTTNDALIARSGLPASVIQSRDDWAYFLQNRYHDHGNWNTPPLTWIDFTWDDLSAEQQKAVRTLEANWNVYLMSEPI